MPAACAFDQFDSPVGPLAAAMTPAGLAHLSYVRAGAGDPIEGLAGRLGCVPEHRPDALAEVRRQLDEYFAGRRRTFDLPLDWSLAPGGFTARALKVTGTIPWGETLTYAEVAAEAGSPRAARAVGNAMRANVLAIVVPCHRVLHRGGGIGGYMGGEANGLSIKRRLLDLEGCRYRG